MDTAIQHTDKEIFIQIAAGDEKAFSHIFHRYAPRLHPFINGIVKDETQAREVLQDVFLRIWLRRDTLPQIENPSAWIYRIASNLSLSQLRRQRLEAKVLAAAGKVQPIHVSAPDETLDGRELNNLIHQAVQQLPPQRRRIFQLLKDEGLSRQETAQRLGISENTVRNQLVIALQSIRDHISQHTGIYFPLILLLADWSYQPWENF